MAKNAAGQAGQKSKNFMNQQIDQRSTQAGERVRADCRERTRAGARARLEHQGESAGRFRELKATFGSTFKSIVPPRRAGIAFWSRILFPLGACSRSRVSRQEERV